MNRPSLFTESGGDGPTLLLLHGLGTNGAVWDRLKPFVEREWLGRWLVPDFRGHGRSSHDGPYGLAEHAADVAALLSQDDEVTIAGHSMGGAVGLLLGTQLFGIHVRRIAAFGVKVRWSAGEISRFRGFAKTAPRVFSTSAEAIERYLAVSGMKGLVPPDSRTAENGIAPCAGGFRLAMDPRANAVAGSSMTAIARSLATPLLIAGGDRDALVTPDEMCELSDAPVVLAGLGHNPHVEAPETLWPAIKDFLLQNERPDLAG